MRNCETNVFCSVCKPYPLVVLSLVLACLLIAGSTQAKTQANTQAENHAPKLSSDHEVASAGFFQLSWETDAKRIELQEASSPAFRNPTTLYIGADSKSVISGKPNGSWYYRVRALDVHDQDVHDQKPQAGAWSDPVTVLVAHHDLSRALMFLSLGVIVFAGIVVMIVRGERAAR